MFKKQVLEVMNNQIELEETLAERFPSIANQLPKRIPPPINNEIEIVYKIIIWESKNYSKYRVIQELEVLGEMPVSILYQNLNCFAKFIRLGDEPKEEEYFLLIENNLYYDNHEPIALLQWVNSLKSIDSSFSLNEFNTNTHISDISLRVGTKYLLHHSSDCGHSFEIASIRNYDPRIDSSKTFPFDLQATRFGLIECEFCEINRATKITRQNRIITWCDQCFKEFYGERIVEFNSLETLPFI